MILFTVKVTKNIQLFIAQSVLHSNQEARLRMPRGLFCQSLHCICSDTNFFSSRWLLKSLLILTCLEALLTISDILLTIHIHWIQTLLSQEVWNEIATLPAPPYCDPTSPSWSENIKNEIIISDFNDDYVSLVICIQK